VVQIGLLKEMEDPDLVLMFCTPGAANIMCRTYTYVTGEPVKGFAGHGACLFTIQYPYVTGKPSFTFSDVSWRKFVGLTEDEISLTFPYRSLTGFIETLPVIANFVREQEAAMGPI